MAVTLSTDSMVADLRTQPDATPAGGITAIIHGRINYLTLGTVIAEMQQFAEKVIVLVGDNDQRIYRVAESLGAEVIDLTRPGKPVAQILAGAGKAAGRLVVLGGDGSNDPYKTPILLEYLNNGYDAVEASGGLEFGSAHETVLHLNNKTPGRRNIQFVACSRACFELSAADLFVKGSRSLSERIIINARHAGMKIKTLELDDKFLDVLSIFRIGVVVPAYNEELLLAETIKGIPDYVNRIYLVDDCSKDRTPEVIKNLTDRRVVAIRHEKNQGVGAAIITGYKKALEDEMDIVAVMAGDNQMDPDELPRLLLPIMEGKADYTKGNRLLNKEFRKGMSSWRSFGNSMLTLITKIGSGYWDVMDPQNGYTAISRQALEAINLDSVYTYYGYCNDILIKLNTYSLRTLDVVMPARYGNETSKIRYGKFIRKVAPMIFRGFLWRLKTKYIVLGFHPLVLFYVLSMIMVPFGGLFGLWILIEKLLHNPVSQNYPLLAAFITLIGVQLLLFAMLFDMQENRDRRGSG